MRRLKTWDDVSYKFKGKKHHGLIREINNDTAEVYEYVTNKIKLLPLSRLTYVPPIYITAEQLQKLCRFEIGWSDIFDEDHRFVRYEADDSYTFTLDDMLAALKKISSSDMDNETILSQWYNPVWNDFCNSNIILFNEETPDNIETLPGLPDRSDKLYTITADIEMMLEPDEPPFTDRAGCIIKEIEDYLDDEKRSVTQRRYTDEEKEEFVTFHHHENNLREADEMTLSLYRSFINELCDKDNKKALKYKGYGCYGGDPAFECDWHTSLSCIKKLYEMTGKPYLANTLGYIYYYGRCWNGQPQYEEAFRYFSIGAAGGIYESRYKLADMFAKGYGVVQNKNIAVGIIEELYEQNLEYMLNGNFDCKFADIALRLGSYIEKGYIEYTSKNHALRFYMQADFAIRQRLKYDHYGDLSVADNTRTSLDRLLSDEDITKPKRTCRIYISYLLKDYLQKYRRIQMNIKRLKNGELSLTFRITPFINEKYHPKMFITEPEAGFCGMVEKLNIHVRKAEISETDLSDDTVEFDNINGSEYYLGDNKVAEIRGEYYFTSPLKKSGKTYCVASVYFSPGGHLYDYLMETEDISVGDKVIVVTDMGETEVTVAAINNKSESELALPINKYKKIVRKANT